MKQKKVKKELVLTTYKDYVRHFGVKLGAKKWKEYKEKESIKRAVEWDREFGAGKISQPIKITDTTDKTAHKGYVEDLEPIQKAVLGGANQDIRKTESDILECGTVIVELISKPVWQRWIKPQIQKDMIDFVMKATMTSGEVRDEAMGGYKYTKKLLKTIDKWIQDYTFIVKREEKKQNASRI